MTNDNFETTSQYFGKDVTVENAFDNQHHPAPSELKEELAETAHLTDKEAWAFVHGYFEGHGRMAAQGDLAERMIQEDGFENMSEFDLVKQTAVEKVADAIWITELIDAYRFPDFSDLSEECSKCSGSLDIGWIKDTTGDQAVPVCVDCADIDLGSLP